MSKNTVGWVSIAFIASIVTPVTGNGGNYVTIPEIQMTDDPDGNSPLNGQEIHCAGGIVVFKREAGKPRLVLIDPNAGDAWGGIQVKGWSRDAFDHVSIGDWVQLENVLVEENAGTTFLQFNAPFGPPSQLTIPSTTHPLPRPVVVDVNSIAGPIYRANDDTWITPNKSAERFESMILQVRNVVVTFLGQGSHNDNYILQNVQGFDGPNALAPSCWAADYLNRDGDKSNAYMSAIDLDARFCAFTGMLEQFTDLDEGYDLYQLLSLSANSFVELNDADLDRDCDVDLWDYSLLAEALIGNAVDGADLNADGNVDHTDVDLYNQAWQVADLTGDGIVDGDDLLEMPL